MKFDHLSVKEQLFRQQIRHLSAFIGAPGLAVQSYQQNLHNNEIIERAGPLGWIDRLRAAKRIRDNIRELRALDDRALKDIGVSRGDIAAIANEVETVESVNALRADLAASRCEVVQLEPAIKTKEQVKTTQVFDNAA